MVDQRIRFVPHACSGAKEPVEEIRVLSSFAGLLPYAVSPQSVTGRAMLHDAHLLASFNAGALTPSCSSMPIEDLLRIRPRPLISARR